MTENWIIKIDVDGEPEELDTVADKITEFVISELDLDAIIVTHTKPCFEDDHCAGPNSNFRRDLLAITNAQVEAAAKVLAEFATEIEDDCYSWDAEYLMEDARSILEAARGVG